MVRKLIVIIVIALMVFVSMNIGALANPEVVGGDSLTYHQKRVVTVDTLVKKFDNLAKVCQDCLVLVEKGVRADGPKVYFQKHKDVFFPIAAFLVLYLIWLRKRARN